MILVNMPIVGQDIPTGTIKEWLVQEGDSISMGDIIVTVESEKATFDVEAPADGILLKILHQQDEEVKVLTPIAYIGGTGENISLGEEIEKQPDDFLPTIEIKVETDFKQSDNEFRIIASPLAKQIAKEEGVDLCTTIGTGLGGRIIKKNVLDAVENSNSDINPEFFISENTISHHSEVVLPLKESEKEIAFDRMRQLIADKLVTSKQTIPHFYLLMDVEMDKALRFKEELAMANNTKITITDLVVHVVLKAMGEFPRMNSHVFSNKYIQFRDINIGLAVSTDDGLRVPVITHADKAGFAELSSRTKKLAKDARNGRIDLNLKAGLTITTLGMYGVDKFLPIINPPQSAILAIGKSSPKVVTDGTSISIKNIMTLTLACDHRLIDGAYAANFLGRIKEIIEKSDSREIKI